VSCDGSALKSSKKGVPQPTGRRQCGAARSLHPRRRRYWQETRTRRKKEKGGVLRTSGAILTARRKRRIASKLGRKRNDCPSGFTCSKANRKKKGTWSLLHGERTVGPRTAMTGRKKRFIRTSAGGHRTSKEGGEKEEAPK